MESICQITETNDVQKMFELRKQLYEHRNKLIDTESEDGIPQESKKELDEINENVLKGQSLLERELETFRKLTKEKVDLKDFEIHAKSTCLECQKMMSQLIIHFENQDIKTTELQTFIDEVIYYIGQVYNIVEDNVKSKNDSLSSRIQKNASYLKYLSDTYKVLRGTNIGYVCVVCMHNEVNVFCDPCGHSFCNKCMTASYCHMCRRKVNTIRNLYFS